MSISDSINKATDEKQTSENWEYIIGACDAIITSNDATIQEAFNTIRKRLESPAGNTQLYTLTLLNALAQSGGTKVKKAIASSETRSKLAKLSRTSHNAVKQRISDILGDLAEAVGDDDFTKFTEQLKVSKRNSAVSVASSSKTHDDEEEQFQRALRLSMQDQSQKAARKDVPSKGNSDARASNSEIMQKINKPMPLTPQELRRVKALYEFTSNTPGDLSFKPGQVITIIENTHRDWWKGTLDGEVGIFPANYVEYIEEKVPTTEEEYIFAQAPNVEKLLSIFASASQHPGYSIVGNQNIQAMYDEVLSLRPQLIRLIDEYSARKQKLMQLNRDVMETRARYEDLVQARISGAATTHGINQYSQPHSPERGRQNPQDSPAQPQYQHTPAQLGQYKGPAPSQPTYDHSENAYRASHQTPSSPAPATHLRSDLHPQNPSDPIPSGGPHYNYSGAPSAPAGPSAPAQYSAHSYGNAPGVPLDPQYPPTQHPSAPAEPTYSAPPAPYAPEQRRYSQHSHTNSASSVAHPVPHTSLPSSPNYTSDTRRTSNPPSAASLPYPV